MNPAGERAVPGRLARRRVPGPKAPGKAARSGAAIRRKETRDDL